MIRLFLCLFLLLSSTLAVQAVEPDELLKDPVLEARARAVSAGLRCLVCQNQSIDESDASVAKDLRILIREQISAGKTDSQVIDFVVARYGDFVLLKPRFVPANYLLWFAPFVLVGAGLLLAFRRQPVPPVQNAELTATEKAELDRLLRK